MMRARKIFALASALCVGWIASPADARTIYAGAGEANTTSGRARFSLADTGVAVLDATGANPLTYSVPVSMDTGGTKFFAARGNPNGLTCVVRQRPTVVADVALPVTASSQSPVFVSVNVVAGNAVWVNCTFTNGSGRLLSIDHTT
jgi:hypothetical protein